jgi:DNA-binding LacI/PurR family transcriptional regulator
MEPQMSFQLGRASTELVALLRAEIGRGRFADDEFLPPERDLAETHSMARDTVRRALKTLANQGLISAVPRRGYRVLPKANDPAAGAPIAYLWSGNREVWTDRYELQMRKLREAANRRGWSVLLVSGEGRTGRQMLADVRAARASALLVDTDDADFASLVAGSGIPAVTTDTWFPEIEIDAVVQDGQRGGLLAASHLVERGHKRIAWFGKAITGSHDLDRLGGTVAGLLRAGLELPAALRVEVSKSREVVRRKLKETFARRPAPTGIVALWRSLAVDIAGAARELGLRLGRDFEMVGWCVDELYEEGYLSAFAGGPVAPAVTWSLGTMVETVLSRLTERRQNPGLPALLTKVPVRLRLHEGGSQS